MSVYRTIGPLVIKFNVPYAPPNIFLLFFIVLDSFVFIYAMVGVRYLQKKNSIARSIDRMFYL